MLVFLLFKESESDYMLTIETKELEISENLLKKVEMICKFACVKPTITNGNIKNIKGTNIALKKVLYARAFIVGNIILFSCKIYCKSCLSI